MTWRKQLFFDHRRKSSLMKEEVSFLFAIGSKLQNVIKYKRNLMRKRNCQVQKKHWSMQRNRAKDVSRTDLKIYKQKFKNVIPRAIKNKEKMSPGMVEQKSNLVRTIVKRD